MAARFQSTPLPSLKRRSAFFSILMIGSLLGMTTADACRRSPWPYTQEDAERFVKDKKGYAFRGKVLERYAQCSDVVSANGPTYNVCYFDLKIDVTESLGRELKGIVLLKQGHRHHNMSTACGYVPRIGSEEYFLVQGEALSVLDTGK